MKRFLPILLLLSLFCAVNVSHAQSIPNIGGGVPCGGGLGVPNCGSGSASVPGGNVPQQLVVPPGFTWSPSFKFFRTGNGVYSTNYNITSCIPTITTTYYVNSVTGASGNPGTPSLPLHTVAQAFAKSDVDQVVIQLSGTAAANGAFINWNGAGWSGTSPTRSVSVVPDAGGRVILASSPAAAAPTWTSEGSSTYSSPLSGTTLGAPTDFKYLDANGDFQHPTPLASAAAVMATAGSYFYDGTAKVYVHASDSRNLIGDPYMTGGYQAQIGAFNTAAAITLYTANIDFVGGYPFLATQPSAPTGTIPTICMNGDTFQGATNATGDGFTINGAYNIFLNNTRSSYNNDDGYGGHAINGVSPFWLDINSACGYNGYSAGGSNQCFSIHDSAVAISLNPHWNGSENQTVRSITAIQHWVLGGFIGCPLETDLNGQTYSLQGASSAWIDGTTICQQTPFTLDSENTSVINGTRTAPVDVTAMTHTAGTGTIQTYTP